MILCEVFRKWVQMSRKNSLIWHIIRGATAPKSQDRLKWLLPDDSTGALWLAKRLSLNLNFTFLNRIRYFSYQVATQFSSRGWVYPVPDPILPEKFLGYSRESNPGPLGWQSDMLIYTTNYGFNEPSSGDSVIVNVTRDFIHNNHFFSLVTFKITESPEDGSLKPKLVVYMKENKI